ncbi:zinc finger FYVE domain-containing protein 16-like isoform X1 [Mobula hypostoma]|uniref:zinc finger FYVE domain-containing protein 16-like isoform X1 n=1 Tax=Mobula hypostoma TaxID=723540 RepID=UPI002FC3009A
MDSYFKSAVCDLDKLLDEFEQNPDESAFCRTPGGGTISADYPSRHSKYSADLPEAGAQTAAVGVDSLLPSNVDAKEPLRQSQNTLTGLDLLSTVDNRTSDCTEQLNNGRGSRPVCDLISDTESMTHETNDHEVDDEINSTEDQAGGSLLIDFNQPSPPVHAGKIECSGEGSFGLLSLLELDIPFHNATENEPQNSGHFNGGVRNQETSIQPENSDVLKQDESLKEEDNLDKLSQCEQREEFSVVSQQSKEICLATEDAVTFNDCKVQEPCDNVKLPLGADLNSVRTVALRELGDVETELEVEKESLKVRYTCSASSTKRVNKVDHPRSSVSSANSSLNQLSGADSTINSVDPEHKPPQNESKMSVDCDLAKCLVMNSDELDSEPCNEEISLVDNAIQNLEHNSDKSLEEHICSEDEENIDEKNENCPNIEWNQQNRTLVMSDAITEAAGKPSEEIQNYTSDAEAVLTYKGFAAEISFEDIHEDGYNIDDDLVSDAELDAFLMEQNENCNLKEGPLASGFPEPHHAGQTDLPMTHDFLNVSEAIVAELSPDPQERGTLGLVDHDKESLMADIQSIPPTTESASVHHPVQDMQVEVTYKPIRTKDSHPVSSTDNNQVVNDTLNNQINFGGARPKLFNSQAKVIPKQDQNNSINDNVEVVGGSLDQCKMYVDTKGTVSESDQAASISSSAYNFSGTEDGTQVLGPSYDSIICDDSVSAEESTCAAEPFIKGTAVLGQNQPQWIPDCEAPNCARCHAKFTFTKRRHHCRACGRVFCAACCYQKCKLQYLENKEARVCADCYSTIQKAHAFKTMMSPTGPSPNPNIPSEYCSTVPPLQQAQASGTLNSPPPTVMVPVSVLKHPRDESSGTFPREHRRVWFADGILPNGEVADPTTMTANSPVGNGTGTTEDVPNVAQETKMPSSHGAGDKVLSDHTSQVDALKTDLAVTTGLANVHGVKADISRTDYRALTAIGKSVPKVMSLIPDNENGLPPIVIATGEKEGRAVVEEHPTQSQALLRLEDGEANPLTFVLNANLIVNVKFVNYASNKCWCFVSNGLHGVGQAEVVILLSCLSEESAIPKDILKFYVKLYQDASKGKTIGNLGMFSFTESFLGSKDHGGFLFVMPTFQTLANLLIPTSPFLFGILIQKLEIPWAKVFPIRLMLRLGAEYNVYPCPLMSVRFRKAFFGDVGHTIMNLLADLRNYQYTLPTIEGLVLHLEMGKSSIKIPKRRYSEVMKVVTSSNEHVVAMATSFSSDADSHLVCIQTEDKNYQTHANTVAEKTRKVTGASFVVFNGALKTTSGFIAKSSLVEDGLMVQVTPETMDGLKCALKEKRDFQIICGKLDSDDRREFVNIQWVDDDKPVNKGILSPLDGRSMENIPSNKISQEDEFENDGVVVKCTEVFYLQRNPDPHSTTIPAAQSHLSKEIAAACCAALCPHLRGLKEIGINKLSLRVSLETDKVEYQAGSRGLLLPQHYMNDLDSALIPVIHNGNSYTSSGPLEMELFFFILEQLI